MNHLNQRTRLNASGPAGDFEGNQLVHMLTTSCFTTLSFHPPKITMPAAKAEEKGESSTAAYKALTSNANGSPTYELPW